MSHDTSTSDGSVADDIGVFVEINFREVRTWFSEVRTWYVVKRAYMIYRRAVKKTYVIHLISLNVWFIVDI